MRKRKDTSQEVPMLFQHKNITVQTSKEIEEGNPVYTFLLKKKLPGIVTRFAEDLLVFDSHEYLSAYFGGTECKKRCLLFFREKIQKVLRSVWK